MRTTREDIARWFEAGRSRGATHMIVVCDTYDHEDFPVYVNPGEDPLKRAADEARKSMQRVMEVYALHLPMLDQLNEPRAFHYEQVSQ